MTQPLRFSHLKHMARSPAHYKWAIENPQEQTAAMRLGAAVDALIFETRPVLGWSSRRAGKDWNAFEEAHPDAIILNDRERSTVFGMVEALLETPAAVSLLRSGTSQETLHWSIGGRQCQGTPDTWTQDRVVDLKTTRDAAPDRFERDARWRAYHAQLAWYRTGLINSGRTKPQEAYIVAVESSPPHPVVIRPLTDRALDQGERLWRLWFERLRVCEQSDEWPGYAQSPVDLDVPDDSFELLVGGESFDMSA